MGTPEERQCQSARHLDRAPPASALLSPATAAVDRGVKLQLYARYAVPDYWIVDLDVRVIETYRLTGQAYEPGPRLEGSTPVAPPPLTSLVLDPVAVWR